MKTRETTEKPTRRPTPPPHRRGRKRQTSFLLFHFNFFRNYRKYIWRELL